MRESIIIIGAARYAHVIIDIIEQMKQYVIVGLVDRAYTEGKKVMGYPLLGREEDLPELQKRYAFTGAVIAVGDNAVRAFVAKKVAGLLPDLPFLPAFHPTAVIAPSSSVGAGSVVMAGAVINPNVQVGMHCIVNTNASLDHDGIMEDFASIAPGAVTGGDCRIGAFTAVGIGAVLLHGITVGRHSVIGAASLVTESLGDNIVAYGVPARVIRSREAGEKYL